MIFYIRHSLPKRIRLARRWRWGILHVVLHVWRFEFCGTRQRLNDSIRSRKHDYG